MKKSVVVMLSLGLVFTMGCDSNFQDNNTNGEFIQCTAAQKKATACTLEYMPVCGDNGVTYGNACEACANIETNGYTNGECTVSCSEEEGTCSADIFDESENENIDEDENSIESLDEDSYSNDLEINTNDNEQEVGVELNVVN